MLKKYYTYRICLNNKWQIKIEKYDGQNQSLGRPSGDFYYQNNREEIKAFLEAARGKKLNKKQFRQLGELLFNSLFDPVLRQDFLNFYFKSVQEEGQLLRIELDIEEQEMPEVAALPWEFLCLPESAKQGTVWLATDPNLVFSRRRALWNPAKPIQLAPKERLRIALAIASPQDENLGKVEYEEVLKNLEDLAKEQSEYIELLPIVNPATATAIDGLLDLKPHIFHFIGHGRLENDEGEQVGQIALVKQLRNKVSWVDAGFFAGLFARHRPGIVVLQACEGGMQSESEAFRGVAPKILAQNIPVVVAMQYKVENVIASIFSSEFYRRLGKGEPVDIAAQNGRYTIALETQYKNRDFATPVIFMRVQNGYLFTQQEKKTRPVSANQPHDKDNLGRVLSELNCKEQKDIFLNKINSYVLNRRGVFLIKTQGEKIRPWFIWCLTNKIGYFHNPKIINTKMDCQLKKNFDFFWQQFSEDLGITGDLDSEKVSEKLIELFRTKSVIIFIRRFQDSYLQNIRDFWDNLSDRITSMTKTDGKRNQLCLVLFLVPQNNDETESDIIEKYQNKGVDLLNLKTISKEEVRNWLDRCSGDDPSQSICNWDKGYEQLDKLSYEDSFGLIDDICSYVLNLESGFVGAENNWREFK